MKPYLKCLVVLLSALLLASPVLGARTYSGGNIGQTGAGSAEGGSYYELATTDNSWEAWYGIDAEVATHGIGVAGSFTTHSLDTGMIDFTAGGTGYRADLAYGGPNGATVTALAKQYTNEWKFGHTYGYSNVYTHAKVTNDNAGNEDMSGDAGLSTYSDVDNTNGEVLTTAAGVAGYLVEKCPTCGKGAERVWGSVKGESTSYAIADGACPECMDESGYTKFAGYASGKSRLQTTSSSSKSKTAAPVHTIYKASSDSGIISETSTEVNQGNHALATSDAKGFAMGGAYDSATSSSLVKQNGVNENAFSSISGETFAIGEGFVKGDESYSEGDLASRAYSVYDNTIGLRQLDTNGKFETEAHVDRDGVYNKFNPKRVSSVGYIINGNYNSVARQPGVTTQSSADAVDVASGAHALNIGDWYSEVEPNGFTDNYASYDGGDIEILTDIHNEQTGPKFIMSATMLDDSGSYIRVKNLVNKVTDGNSPVLGLSIDNIDFMNWIEGSALGNNMYPSTATWNVAYTQNVPNTHSSDYLMDFQDGDPVNRKSSAEITAKINNL